MDKACARILDAIDREETVSLGDYDVERDRHRPALHTSRGWEPTSSVCCPAV